MCGGVWYLNDKSKQQTQIGIYIQQFISALILPLNSIISANDRGNFLCSCWYSPSNLLFISAMQNKH